jgi:hydrogenase maturation protein HypF
VTAAAGRVRARARVTGTVQGVGFRPFVYRLAHQYGLAGWVLNDEHGVLLEVEGAEVELSQFFDRLSADAPPLARVESVSPSPAPVTGEHGFRIVQSARGGDPDALIAPDAATCDDCLTELRDPRDRRYRYPFINCTNCGPRFTIVRGVPYDRPLTTMAGFQMCDACRGEYEDPGDRRFHAQPNACPACGPQVRLVDAAGRTVANAPRIWGSDRQPSGDDPISALAARLYDGAIAAVKGLGGYHLVCNAANERAVATLRARKHREDKPFALMVADVATARELVRLDASAEALLCSPARPIVLAPRVADGGPPVAAAVAPGAPELGVMLPYTPLHHLLLADFPGDALVMTSGNVSDEPIAYRDEDALQRLSAIADLFLIHDREIETRTDDSVLRSVRGRQLMLRRSRGYVPAPLTLPVPASRPLLACGAEQKATFCVARGDRAWVGHHIGDLEHVATLTAYREGVEHFQAMFAVAPELAVHDLHPDYLSTQYALELDEVELIGIQHHHAHLAACLAEHGVTTPAVGAIFDGTGLGSDGTVWGGELLVGDLRGYERAGWLFGVRMPGGAAAVRQPWRMAATWLAQSQGDDPPLPGALAGVVSPADWEAVAQVGRVSELSPLTSSIGRLFDAVGVLCGAPAQVSYEGQAAVELEALAWTAGAQARDSGYAFERDSVPAAVPAPGTLDGAHGAHGAHLARIAALVLDPRAAVNELARDLQRGVSAAVVAARFHAGVAEATVDAVMAIAAARGLETAVLSGGVFQNRLLLQTVAAGLDQAGLRVLVPERLPPNDGGIPFGQAAIAAAQ